MDPEVHSFENDVVRARSVSAMHVHCVQLRSIDGGDKGLQVFHITVVTQQVRCRKLWGNPRRTIKYQGCQRSPQAPPEGAISRDPITFFTVLTSPSGVI